MGPDDFAILSRLDIPLSDLLAAYHELGVPTPALAPAGEHDPWDTFIADPEVAMRDAGLRDDAIAAVLTRIRQKRDFP